MSLREAVERWRTASEAGDIEAMDEAARATLRTHDDRSRTVARTAVMAAMGEAANVGDEAALRVALAKIEPADLEAFREAVPTRPLPVARAVSNINDPRPAAILSAAGEEGAVLSVGEICLLSGEGGVGKSALAGEIALAIAGDGNTGNVGNGLLAIDEGSRGGGVLWLTYEEAPGELAARLNERAKAMRAYAGAPDRVRVLDMRGGWPLFGPGDGASYSTRPGKLAGWDAMRGAMDVVPRLIVVDPVLAAYVGEPNAAAPVREFLGGLAALAREYEAGVLALAHSRKSARGGKNDSTADPFDPGQVAGSTAWHDGVRGVLTFNFHPAGDTSRVLAIAKANMGPARIQCVAQPVRATSSGWILGFKAGDTWHDRKGDDTPAGGSAGKVPNV